MKKRLIISNYDDSKNPFYSGGGSRAVHETAKRLTKDFSVTVITGAYPSSQNENIDGVFYERYGITFSGPKIGQLVFQAILPFLVISKQYDIWLESFTPPFSTNCLQLFTDKPVIGLVHMLSGEEMKRKYKLPFDRIEALGLKTYKHFIVTSTRIKSKILKSNRSATIVTIPNGFNKVKVKKLIIKNTIFIGRIEVNQKGLDLLVDAFDLIREKTKQNLYIVGGGEPKQINLLKSHIVSKKLSKRVILLGQLDGNEKNNILNKASCIVVSSRFETFSMVSLEALAYEIPLITFAIPGLSWIPEKCRFVVKKLTTQKLAEAILSVLVGGKNVDEKIVAGKEFADKFTWEHSAMKYEKYLKSLI